MCRRSAASEEGAAVVAATAAVAACHSTCTWKSSPFESDLRHRLTVGAHNSWKELTEPTATASPKHEEKDLYHLIYCTVDSTLKLLGRDP